LVSQCWYHKISLDLLAEVWYEGGRDRSICPITDNPTDPFIISHFF
jgi:hypothetical protein